MDRRVKERLIGATLLVIVIVLVVPELLSGPKPARAPAPANPAATVRTYTVDLAQNSATPQPAPAAMPQTTVAAPGTSPPQVPAVAPGTPMEVPTTTLTAGTASTAAAPAGAGTQPPAAAPLPLESAASSPISVQHKPVAAPVAVAANAPAAGNVRLDERDSAAPGAWTVQLGSFANRANAQALARSVKAKGFVVYVSSSGAGSTLRYRVRTGPWADRDAALQAIAKLKSQGQAASLVAPAP
jgi:DedD protein